MWRRKACRAKTDETEHPKLAQEGQQSRGKNRIDRCSRRVLGSSDVAAVRRGDFKNTIVHRTALALRPGTSATLGVYVRIPNQKLKTHHSLGRGGNAPGSGLRSSGEDLNHPRSVITGAPHCEYAGTPFSAAPPSVPGFRLNPQDHSGILCLVSFLCRPIFSRHSLYLGPTAR